MYSSAFITQTFLSLLLFQLQITTSAEVDSGLMRLRVQRRGLADSSLSEGFLSSDIHLPPEETSRTGVTTLSSGDVLVDDGDPGQIRSQQSWLQKVPVETLLTDCTTTTDESDRSLSPSNKFQRRQTGVSNHCTPELETQPGRQDLKLDGQGQGPGQMIPKGTPPGKPSDIFPPNLTTPPTAMELLRLEIFGLDGHPQWICDEFVGQTVPMCAPTSLSILVSPADVVTPSRFCKSCFSLSRFRFSVSGFYRQDRKRRLEFLCSDSVPPHMVAGPSGGLKSATTFFLSFSQIDPQLFSRKKQEKVRRPPLNDPSGR